MHIETNASQCSGCTACQAVCPAKAIDMLPEDEGFLVPHVDATKCLECGLCIKICPVQNPTTSEETIKSYAVRWENEMRSNSASGALFPALAKVIISYKHGYVCGCVL